MNHCRLPQLTGVTRATFIAMFATVGFTTTYLIQMYPELPFAVPVRFVSERAVIYQMKSPLLTMLPVAVQLALAAMIAPLVVLLMWRPAANVSSPARDQHVNGMAYVAEGIALIGLVWMVVQALAAVRLVALWEKGSGGFGDTYTLALITAAVLSMTIGARTLLTLTSVRQPALVENAAEWRLRFLYFNPKNPWLFVPARAGLGWTLNFGRPLAIAVMAAMLSFGVVAPYYIASNILKGYWH